MLLLGVSNRSNAAGGVLTEREGEQPNADFQSNQDKGAY
jgi:hypothetical protein